MRRLIAGVAGAALALSLAACGGSSSGAGDKGTIGVAMPTKSSERWIADGNNIKKQLEAAGYKVDLQYAEDDIPTQVSQVENMSLMGVSIDWQQAVKGLVLLAAVAFDVWNKKRTSVGGGAGSEDASTTAPPPDDLVDEIKQAEVPGTEGVRT